MVGSTAGDVMHAKQLSSGLSLVLAYYLVACGSAPTAASPASGSAPSGVDAVPADADRCEPSVQYVARISTSSIPTLPAVPSLPERAVRAGDAYTVWGASYSLRSPVHRAEVEKTIQLVGYITKTNLPDAPRCAVHPSGMADPEDCRTPIPTFWLGDTPDAPVDECIEVLGWASNFAQLHDAIRQYDTGDEPYIDVFWGVPIPNPLPAKGAKVLVEGEYSEAFTKATLGVVVRPVMGVLTMNSMTELEAAPELATLPGMKRRRR
jgi:hypothetical protein